MKTKKLFRITTLIALVASFVSIDKNVYANSNICNTPVVHRTLSERNCEKDSVLSFLNRFCTDTNFQYSRIVFPIIHVEKMDAYDEDDIVSNIKKEEWKYVNFLDLPNNYVINVEENRDVSFKLNIQIEDTGVSVSYVFELIDCMWHLTNIIDESV